MKGPTLELDEEGASRGAKNAVPGSSCSKIFGAAAHDQTEQRKNQHLKTGRGSSYRTHLERKCSRSESWLSGASSFRRTASAFFVSLASRTSRNFCCRMLNLIVCRPRARE